MRQATRNFAKECGKTLFALVVYVGMLGGIGVLTYQIAQGGTIAIKLGELIDYGLEWIKPAEKRESVSWMAPDAPPPLRGTTEE